METTTGMSAPPIAITMCTPNTPATAVMISIDESPPWSGAPTKRVPSRTMASSRAPFSQWRAGRSKGLPPSVPRSLPYATSDPVKVTMPTNTPRKISISWMVASTPE